MRRRKNTLPTLLLASVAGAALAGAGQAQESPPMDDAIFLE